MMASDAGGQHDLSNVGRCVRCGEPIDMRDEGDNLVVMEDNEPDHPDVDVEDVRDGMADAIRAIGGPEDEPLAVAYEEGEEIVLHEDCHDESALPELYSGDPEPEGDDSE